MNRKCCPALVRTIPRSRGVTRVRILHHARGPGLFRLGLFGVVLAVLLVALDAKALEQSMRFPALHWTRVENAEACIDPRSLADRVEQLAGPVLVSPSQAQYSIEGYIEKQDGSGFRVRITVTAHDGKPVGERVLNFTQSDCRELDASIAFVIAVIIDPSLMSQNLPDEFLALKMDDALPEEALLAELQRNPPKPAKLGPKQNDSKPLPTRTEPKPVSKAKRQWHPFLEADLGVLTSGSELPRMGLGAAVRVTWLATSWLAVGAQFRWLTAFSRYDIEGQYDHYSVSAEAIGSALSVCGRLSVTDELMTQLCLGPELRTITARGTGFEENRTGSITNLGALGRVDVGWEFINSWKALVTAMAHLAFDNKSFTYSIAEQKRSAFSPDTLSFFLGIGGGYSF